MPYSKLQAVLVELVSVWLTSSLAPIVPFYYTLYFLGLLHQICFVGSKLKNLGLQRLCVSFFSLTMGSEIRVSTQAKGNPAAGIPLGSTDLLPAL